MNRLKIRKRSILLTCIFLCWATVAAIDYSRCKNALPPIFSVSAPVTDQDRYRGLGYTISISYAGPVGAAEEKPRGLFRWGWH